MSVVCLRDVSKRYWVSHEKPALVRELIPRLVRPLHYEKHWALRDIDLEIAHGEALGIIGPNGSGKTTLLSIIAGITEPTTGTVTVQGKVAALLSLGSGFHPELTGLENIFLNGALLGMSTREIRRKLEAIVTFSQLDGFIDAPLQTYSSGMQLRLGFAIAIHADFDLLLIDEVMAVGDLAFQQKCLTVLQQLRSQDKTLVLVSQSSESIEPLCDRVILLERGRLIAEGTAHLIGSMHRRRSLSPAQGRCRGALTVEPVDGLREQLRLRLDSEHVCSESVKALAGTRVGSGAIQMQEVELLNAADEPRTMFQTGEPLTVRARFIAQQEVPQAHFGVAIFREPDFAYVYGPNTLFDGLELSVQGDEVGEVRLRIDRLWLQGGSYLVSVAWWNGGSETLQGAYGYTSVFPHDYHVGCYRFQVSSPHNTTGLCHLPHEVVSGPSACDEARAPKAIQTGEPLTIAWPRSRQNRRRLPACVQIIREDGLECFGVWCDQALRIPELSLLAGRYWVSIDGKPHQELLVSSPWRDHGCVYLPHCWTIASETMAQPVEAELLLR